MAMGIAVKDRLRVGHVHGMAPERDEAETFRRIFEDHFDDLWRFARRRCESPSDADDIVAETFAVAWRRRVDIPEAARLWLFGVARHVLSNQHRSTVRRDRLHRRLIHHHRLGVGGDPADQVDDGTLRGAVARLGADDREILIMRCWDGLAVQEIATLLGCSPNAASLRLHKARHRLADHLGRKEGGCSGQVIGDPLARRDERHA